MSTTYKINDEVTHTTSAYSRAHVLSSLLPAMNTIDMDIRYRDADSLLDTIEQNIIKLSRNALLSKDELAGLVYEALKAYDAVSGLQYAVQHGLLTTVTKRKRGRPSIS